MKLFGISAIYEINVAGGGCFFLILYLIKTINAVHHYIELFQSLIELEREFLEQIIKESRAFRIWTMWMKIEDKLRI